MKNKNMKKNLNEQMKIEKNKKISNVKMLHVQIEIWCKLDMI